MTPYCMSSTVHWLLSRRCPTKDLVNDTHAETHIVVTGSLISINSTNCYLFFNDAESLQTYVVSQPDVYTLSRRSATPSHGSPWYELHTPHLLP